MITSSLKFALIIGMISITLVSCYQNNSCRPSYIGTYMIDTSLITDPDTRINILNRHWDTVRLFSNNDGSYHFSTSDVLLKQSEGKWTTKSNDIEGNCFGYVWQKNMSREFIRQPFDIFVRLHADTYILPFRRIPSK